MLPIFRHFSVSPTFSKFQTCPKNCKKKKVKNTKKRKIIKKINELIQGSKHFKNALREFSSALGGR